MDAQIIATAVGGTGIAAGIADSQAQIDQALGAGPTFGADSLASFAAAYRSSGGGPTLALIGYNPFQVVATGAFHSLYWGAVVVFLGIAAVIALQRSLVGRNTLTGRHPLAAVSQVYFRLLVGALIIANIPMIYAVLMTVASVCSQGVTAMAQQSAAQLLQTGGMGTLSLAETRIEAIRSAAARRAIALYPRDASRNEMAQIGAWYVAAANAINSALAARNLFGQLPLLDTASLTDPGVSDAQAAALIGRTVVQNFGQMVADLGALPPDCGPLTIAFPAGGSTSLPLLSEALSADDEQAAAVLALPNTPSNATAYENARQLYSRSVLADTLSYLDTQLLSVIAQSPSLSRRIAAWFSERVEQAAAAATGFATQWRAAVDWLGRGIGIVLTRMVAFLFAAATGALIEVELFVLVLAVPLWLLPATEGAFYGVVRSLVSLSLVVPAYQFIMVFVDGLMGLVLKYLLFGPLASGASASAAVAGGAVHLAAVAVAVVGSGGEVVTLAMACYLAAYVFLAVYAAVKTPKLLAAFMKGAGAASLFLSTFATGLVSGAATALATAAVAGGGGLAGRLLGAGPLGGSGAGPRRTVYRAPPAATVLQPQPAAEEPSPGPAASPAGPIRPSAAPRILEAGGFAWRTFTNCMDADSPGEGLDIALRALDAHRKLKEKEAEARSKAQRQAEKADAKPARRRAP